MALPPLLGPPDVLDAVKGVRDKPNPPGDAQYWMRWGQMQDQIRGIAPKPGTGPTAGGKPPTTTPGPSLYGLPVTSGPQPSLSETLAGITTQPAPTSVYGDVPNPYRDIMSRLFGGLYG